MTFRKLLLAAALAAPITAPCAKPPTAALDDLTPDATPSAFAAKAAPGVAEVGDADSFGRNVKWLGLAQTGAITLASSCVPAPGDPPPGPDDRCVTLNPAPASTAFDFPDVARIKLPGKSAESLLCHWLSPIISYSFSNTTGVFQPNAQFRLTPYIVIESPVLADPALINPVTGLPFGGVLESGFSATYLDSRSLQPGDRQLVRHSQSRTCIAGFLSRRSLVENYGLTEAQAKEVFKKDMALRIGVRGSAAMVSSGQVLYGLRVVGD
jgi:hypothetical protein